MTLKLLLLNLFAVFLNTMPAGECSGNGEVGLISAGGNTDQALPI